MSAKPRAPIDGVAWEDLAVLLAGLEYRSLNQAAAALQIGQSTASRRIVRLEERLGAKLFERVPEGLRPTALAQSLEPHARKIEIHMADIERLARGQGAEALGPVRLAVPDGLAAAWILPELSGFFSRHPDIELTILESQSIADLLRHEADIALRVVAPTEPSLVSLKLGRLPLLPHAHPSIAESSERPLRWVRLEDPTSAFVETRWIEENIAPRHPLVVSQWSSMLAALQAGLGAGLVHPRVARRAGLVPLSGSFAPGPSRTLYLVSHPAARELPAVAALRTWLLEAARAFFEETGPDPA